MATPLLTHRSVASAHSFHSIEDQQQQPVMPRYDEKGVEKMMKRFGYSMRRQLRKLQQQQQFQRRLQQQQQQPEVESEYVALIHQTAREVQKEQQMQYINECAEQYIDKKLFDMLEFFKDFEKSVSRRLRNLGEKFDEKFKLQDDSVNNIERNVKELSTAVLEIGKVVYQDDSDETSEDDNGIAMTHDADKFHSEYFAIRREPD